MIGFKEAVGIATVATLTLSACSNESSSKPVPYSCESSVEKFGPLPNDTIEVMTRHVMKIVSDCYEQSPEENKASSVDSENGDRYNEILQIPKNNRSISFELTWEAKPSPEDPNRLDRADSLIAFTDTSGSDHLLITAASTTPFLYWQKSQDTPKYYGQAQIFNHNGEITTTNNCHGIDKKGDTDPDTAKKTYKNTLGQVIALLDLPKEKPLPVFSPDPDTDPTFRNPVPTCRT